MIKSMFSRIKNKNVQTLLAIGVASILIRLLIQYDFDRSALLYVGIPFLIAIFLLTIDRPKHSDNWKRSYLNLVILSLAIMLGSSIVLFEGFICVVMFMPIYFGVILLVFLFEALGEYLKRRRNGKNYVHVLPLFIAFGAFEGVLPEFSFERDYQVTSEKIILGSVDDIKNQLIQPINLNNSRHWMLELFPMPYEVQAESLSPGDIHTISFRYHRWFVTNTHEGSMKLEISEVKDNYIRTTFVDDTSYISNYLELQGTEIYLTPIGDKQTKVTLTINYHRFLDPVWYFGPLQEYTVKRTAQFLLDDMITPK
ncbi:hypothetical protein J7384_05315 [Endozoicomonas sp. G2_1]|uniref:hypothetical protein n=1 Tax=Endozoicomonas sp. G2_1 TaxID=2821091 RepID=UPI001ADD26B8|nr:hypothetical protein [Endozoicomonas sp. G2_1]MBO9489778.1 hypothetical protein [Endozoicomonas sp. G2_1]